GLGSSDPRQFGQAFGSTLMMAGGVAAPYAGAAGIPEAAEAAAGEEGALGGELGTAESPASYESLVEQAREAYPNKAGRLENHHITPKYLGGAADGPTVELDAAYHQWITNAFRREFPYGQKPPGAADLGRIMGNVYRRFPLPPGTGY
ncbi:MAG TPA: hypothetical protein VGS41_05915, partial [Chthonomonadales bacterium]|nr:hypothetical protein [Chthonomonadales bacterium]